MNAISVPVDAATEEALDKIAAATKRSRQDIAAEALSLFAREEADTIAAILDAQAQVMAGNTVSHEEAMARLWKTVRGE